MPSLSALSDALERLVASFLIPIDLRHVLHALPTGNGYRQIRRLSLRHANPNKVVRIAGVFASVETLVIDTQLSNQTSSTMKELPELDAQVSTRFERLTSLRLRGVRLANASALRSLRREMQILELTAVRVPDLAFLASPPFAKLVELRVEDRPPFGLAVDFAVLESLTELGMRRVRYCLLPSSRWLERLSLRLRVLDLHCSHLTE
ncbi:hypothetical protein Poli38472_008073 [Pythium oligandrum]|uniref:Uncharacterized protein n=1 Tax=Pythium oligandrum TaxID=41045 RepID=A0A8K1FJY7_PYTOL|nr:hypothetical protein Poli38472_008073 [Pythium oligandrum]|eukprot:TMW65431.1 hypothetical protein Poli38472_008073 [Pythium oligandrum]